MDTAYPVNIMKEVRNISACEKMSLWKDTLLLKKTKKKTCMYFLGSNRIEVLLPAHYPIPGCQKIMLIQV